MRSLDLRHLAAMHKSSVGMKLGKRPDRCLCCSIKLQGYISNERTRWVESIKALEVTWLYFSSEDLEIVC